MIPAIVLEHAAELLRTVGHPTRLAILLALSDGPRCVHDLVSSVGSSQSAVSQHLRLLRSLRMVKATRRGREVEYVLQDQHVAQIARDAIQHIQEGDQR